MGSWVGPWEETRKEQVVTGPWKDRVGWSRMGDLDGSQKVWPI